MSTSKQGECGCKVGRVATEHDLEDVDEWLVQEWQAGTSVRKLTETLNRDLTAARVADSNTSRIEWSRTPVYEALETDELRRSEEIEIRRELERAGIDVAELESTLVSHQTVYRHLTNCLDAALEDDVTPEERREKALDTVSALQQRTAVVAESKLDSLQTTSELAVADPDVIVDVQVVCQECGRSMDYDRALSKGCDCEDGGRSAN